MPCVQAVQSVLLQLGAKPGGVLHTAVMELCEVRRTGRVSLLLPAKTQVPSAQ